MKVPSVNIPVNWEQLGAYLAHEDSVVQAKFFAQFAKELMKACKTHYNTEIQMHDVRNEMEKLGLDIANNFAEFNVYKTLVYQDND